MFKEGYYKAVPRKENGERVAKAVGATFERDHLQLEGYKGSKGHEARSHKPNRDQGPK